MIQFNALFLLLKNEYFQFQHEKKMFFFKCLATIKINARLKEYAFTRY